MAKTCIEDYVRFSFSFPRCHDSPNLSPHPLRCSPFESKSEVIYAASTSLMSRFCWSWSFNQLKFERTSIHFASVHLSHCCWFHTKWYTVNSAVNCDHSPVARVKALQLRQISGFAVPGKVLFFSSPYSFLYSSAFTSNALQPNLKEKKW